MLNFLVALDGSAASPDVFARVLMLAQPKRDRIILINIQPKLSDSPSENTSRFRIHKSGKETDLKMKISLDHGHEILGVYEAQAKQAGFPAFKVTSIVLIGDPRTILCEQVEKVKANYLICGSRGFTGLKRIIVGSVSHYCSQYANCNVVVVKSNPLKITFVEGEDLYVPKKDLRIDKDSSKNKERVGEQKARLGYTAKYPVIIIPGLASSAMEAWETPVKKWFRKRIWLSFAKLTLGTKEMWLDHLKLQADGYSDPPGIKIRPVEGLHGIDYLDEGMFVESATYMFGYVIHNLADVGYIGGKNLFAAAYDWRISPSMLQERDRWMNSLKCLIEAAKQINEQKVVLVAHSMGNKMLLYFFQWIKDKVESSWIDDHIEAYVAISSPYLGAPKAIRGLTSGDRMGLEFLVDDNEALEVCRTCSSGAFLFPIFFNERMNTSFCYLLDQSKKPNSYTLKSIPEILAECNCQNYYWDIFDKMYVHNDLYLDGQVQPIKMIPPALKPPPVKKLRCIYGVNMNTEIQYFFKKNSKENFLIRSLDDVSDIISDEFDQHNEASHKHMMMSTSDLESSKSETSPSSPDNNVKHKKPLRLHLDGDAEKFFRHNQKSLDLLFKDGIVYETASTFQPSCGKKISGDGTVPYASLNYCSSWIGLADAPSSIEIVEVPGASHRSILKHNELMEMLIDTATEKKQQSTP